MLRRSSGNDCGDGVVVSRCDESMKWNEELWYSGYCMTIAVTERRIINTVKGCFLKTRVEC